MKKQANNDDILNYVSEPLNVPAQQRNAKDALFTKNMKYMDIVKGETNEDYAGLSDLARRQQYAIEDGKDLPMSLAERRANTISMNPLTTDEASVGGYNLVQWEMLDQPQ